MSLKLNYNIDIEEIGDYVNLEKTETNFHEILENNRKNNF